jgi:hypothetical protein
LPQSASCSENFVIPPDVFGQTLKDTGYPRQLLTGCKIDSITTLTNRRPLDIILIIGPGRAESPLFRGWRLLRSGALNATVVPKLPFGRSSAGRAAQGRA